MNAAVRAISLLVAAAGAAAAQPASFSPAGRLAFRVFNEDHGLGNLTVEALLQDRVGFLWVGTQNGLYRFDGRAFVPFGREAGFKSTRVFALHEAADGTLYVATRAGLSRREGEGFRHLTPADGIPEAPVAGVASDGARIYVASEAGLLVGDGRSFRTEPAPPGAAGAATAVLAADGHVYVAFEGVLFERESDGWRDVGTDAGLPASERIDRVSVDAKGRLFVRTVRTLWMRPAPAEFFVPLHDGLPAATTAGRLERGAQGEVLLPTSRGVAHRVGDSWRMLGRREGLPGDVALSALVDREGSLWVGLGGVGLAQRLGRGDFASWGLADGLSHEVVWSIARDRAAGALWVGTQGGLNRLDLAAGVMRTWHERDGLAGDLVYAVCAAPDGGVWAGSWRGGVTRIPAKGGAPRRYLAADLTPGEFEVIALHQRPDGELWAGSSRGPFRLAAGADAFQPAGLPGGPPRDGVYAFAENGQGELFAAGSGGIQRLNGDAPRRFTTADGLKDDFVASIAWRPDDSFVVGYREALGVARVRVHRDRLEILPLEPAGPLASDKVLFVGGDSTDRLWVGSDRGLDVFSADGRQRRRFARAHGLPTEDMNQNAFFADADGVVWLGTSRGLVRYQPSEPLAQRPSSQRRDHRGGDAEAPPDDARPAGAGARRALAHVLLVRPHVPGPAGSALSLSPGRPGGRFRRHAADGGPVRRAGRRALPVRGRGRGAQRRDHARARCIHVLRDASMVGDGLGPRRGGCAPPDLGRGPRPASHARARRRPPPPGEGRDRAQRRAGERQLRAGRPQPAVP